MPAFFRSIVEPLFSLLWLYGYTMLFIHSCWLLLFWDAEDWTQGLLCKAHALPSRYTPDLPLSSPSFPPAPCIIGLLLQLDRTSLIILWAHRAQHRHSLSAFFGLWVYKSGYNIVATLREVIVYGKKTVSISGSWCLLFPWIWNILVLQPSALIPSTKILSVPNAICTMKIFGVLSIPSLPFDFPEHYLIPLF